MSVVVCTWDQGREGIAAGAERASDSRRFLRPRSRYRTELASHRPSPRKTLEIAGEFSVSHIDHIEIPQSENFLGRPLRRGRLPVHGGALATYRPHQSELRRTIDRPSRSSSCESGCGDECRRSARQTGGRDRGRRGRLRWRYPGDL